MAYTATAISAALLISTGIIYFVDASTVDGHDDDWDYSGTHGPDSWPELCQTGQRQSPININPALVDSVNISELQFRNYDRFGNISLTNNGHTTMVNGFENWSNRPHIRGGGLNGTYNLVSFHFHWSAYDYLGSEHTIGLLSYPLELHLVHVKEDLSQNESLTTSDGMAVVAIFFYKGIDGRALEQLEHALQESFDYGTKETVSNFLLKELLPQHTNAFYRYEGSLTTPGCFEAVIWTLLAEPVSVSELQLRRLRKHMSTSGKLLARNHRRPQPLNGRRVLLKPHGFE